MAKAPARRYDLGNTAVQLTAVPERPATTSSTGRTASSRPPGPTLNVTANINVTANFAIDTYTLTYTAGADGTIDGTSPQTVNYGADGTLGDGRAEHRLPLRRLVRRRPHGRADGPQRHGQHHRHGQLRDRHLHADLHGRRGRHDHRHLAPDGQLRRGRHAGHGGSQHRLPLRRLVRRRPDGRADRPRTSRPTSPSRPTSRSTPTR